MKISGVLILIILHLHGSVFSQTKDSLVIRVSNVKTADKRYSLHNVQIFNISKTPVCILHSTYINLIYDPPQKLALFDKSAPAESFSLLYSAKDTLNDYENTNDNFGGEPILPNQKIEFRILIPRQKTNKKYLEIDYLFMPDFCYVNFRDELFKNASLWHKKYVKLRETIKLAF